MKVIDKINYELSLNNTFYSFEYFPPKTQTSISNLIDRVDRMSQTLTPLFVDMTWGAGGKSSENTLFLSSYIQNYLHTDVLMHITCRCQTKEKLDYALEQAKANNIVNLLILRGDPPQGNEDYDFSKDPFQYAEDMIKYVKEKYLDYFCICVAGYPSTHIESKNKEEDLYYLKRKVDAGADMIITQLFYDPDEYLAFIKQCKESGISVPILPGILPVNNYNSFKKIINLCKIKVPGTMIDDIELIKHDEEKIKEFGVRTTIELIKKLMENGVKGFHFYTMNLEKSVTEIIEKMKIKREKRGKELPWNPRKQPCSKDSNGINGSNNTTTKKQTSFNSPITPGKDFSVESIRPIFWANNARSYISKTFYWDEFPNGIWGDSRSPAFGNNEEHLHTFGEHYKLLNQSKGEVCKKLWGAHVTSYVDISKVFIAFLDGSIKKIPWAENTDIQEETSVIKDLLFKMNSKMLFTINSQPAVNAAESNDKIYGWGGDNGYVYQKMYVEFFIQKDVMLGLIDCLKDSQTILYQAVNLKEEKYENFKTSIVCGLTWGVFPNKEIQQPTIYDSEVFSVWKDEAFEKWDEWARTYDKEDEKSSNEFLKKAKNELFLMTIVDNDYIKPKADQIILKYLSELS